MNRLHSSQKTTWGTKPFTAFKNNGQLGALACSSLITKVSDMILSSQFYKYLPYLDYANFMFGKPSNANFSNQIKSAPYNIALAITETIRDTSNENLYQELVFETMKEKRWLRRLCSFYKILNNQANVYLYSLLPPK